MQLKGKTLGVVAACLATFALAAPAYAYTAMYTCDNDTTTYYTYFDTPGGLSTTWQKLSSGNYGDSRISYYVNDHYWYHWNISTGDNAPHSYKLEVYLNNASFTNTSAQYDIAGVEVNRINQNAAPTGWSTVGYETNYGTVAVSLDSFDYLASTTSTGADTVRISW